jgi:membrane-bound lytic murein transglycosylase D
MKLAIIIRSSHRGLAIRFFSVKGFILRLFFPRAAIIPQPITLLVFFMVLFTFIGCGSSKKQHSTLEKNDIIRIPDSMATASRGDSLAGMAADSAAAALEDTVYGNPSELLEEAQLYCSEGEYDAADSTLKEAVKAIGSMDEESENGEWFPSSRYIDKIVTIYKEKMPDSFSIPEEITMAVFQQQMLRSIDSLNIMPSESLSQAVLYCQKGITYDVPMVWNDRVQRSLYFYLRIRASTIDRWFFRANYYLPIMKKMFADSGLPQDLAYLPLIESGFNPLAYSYAHASGIWQFIASTGKTYGLRRSFWIDERRDPIRSTEAAIGFLRKLNNDFNDWHLALAAYNCGENGVARNIARSKTRDFWNLKKLPRQTRNYVPFYLAALTIAKNPRCFGVVMPPTGTMPLDTIHLTACIALGDIAAGLGAELDTLKKLNPHIMRWCTSPDTFRTILYLPSGAKKRWKDFYSRLPPEKKVRWSRHMINRGENIETIALKYNVAADALKTINRITTPRLTSGHHLFIPLADTVFGSDVAYTLPPESEIKLLDVPDYEFAGVMVRHRILSGDNLGKIARRYHVSIAQICRWNRVTRRTILRPGRVLVVSRPRPVEPAAAGVTTTVAAAGTGATHLVQIGDSPFSVSRKYNMTVQELAALNNLNVEHPLIRIGQTLKLSPTATDTAKALIASVDSQSVTSLADTVKTPIASANSVPKMLNADTSTVKIASPAPVEKVISIKKDTVRLPAKPSIASTAADSLPDSTVEQQEPRTRYYIIAPGDNLYRISKKHSVSVASFMSANHIADASLVRTGDSLFIPTAAEAAMARPRPEGPGIVYYKVKDGDTLWRIATQFGVPVDSLYKSNNMTPDTVLTPGLVIKVVTEGDR